MKQKSKMKQINNETKELIKKYAEYRGAMDERLTFEILLEVYIAATKKARANYKREMIEYIDAVDSEKIQKGVPIILAELSN